MKILKQTKNGEKREDEIKNNILSLKAHLMMLEEQSRTKRSQTSALYDYIRQKLLDRETFLFKSISEHLEQETQIHRKLIGQYERQLKHIQDLKSEVNRITSNEHPMETLANAAFRN